MEASLINRTLFHVPPDAISRVGSNRADTDIHTHTHIACIAKVARGAIKGFPPFPFPIARTVQRVEDGSGVVAQTAKGEPGSTLPKMDSVIE